MNKPNVLLLTLDTLRADMLGCYGHPAGISPNIDRLAAGGLRFEQAITGGSWTQAAFPVLLTSSHASLYGGCLGPLSPERPSPIEALAAHGYTTAAFSTSPLLSGNYGYDRGFHAFHDLVPGASDPWLRRLKGGERLLRSSLPHHIARRLGQQLRPAPLYVSAAELHEQLTGWLGTVHGPFFAWAHYMDIHWPYHCEERLIEPGEIAQAWRDLGIMHRANWKGGTVTAVQRERFIRLYEESVRYTDAQIGRLMENLTQLGLADNTIIVLVSDHGEEFLERRHWGHFEVNLFDEILKVPLIIHVPGMTTGAAIPDQVRLLDIMPTILALTGCAPPDGLEGVSMVPLLDGAAANYDGQEAISEMWRDDWHIIAVRTERFKYIWNSRQPEQPELYDLAADPEERQNIHRQFPEQAHHFQSRVDAHRRRARATAGVTANQNIDVDELLVHRLRGLGYLE